MFDKKKILILGFARSGYEVAKILKEHECEVILNDLKEENQQNQEQVNELRNLGVELLFGSHPENLLDDSFDYMVKNPGIRNDHMYVKKAQELGIPVMNEVEVAYRLLPDDVTIIGITGTNGKTTTTTLTYEIMKAAYQERVHLAGNIGYPLCSILNKVKSNDIIVMEVSCQQGANFDTFHPHIALVTNFSEAHIDFFGSYEAYKHAKSKMFYQQKEEDIAILNMENEDVLEELDGISSKVKYFSSKHEINGCYLKENDIYYYDEKVMPVSKIKIKGMHNVENCMAAIMIAKEMGVDNKIIEEVISSFKGVEHRLEFVGEVEGRSFYNDTEATNIKCTQIALSSFTSPIILFLGGLERGQNFEELVPMMGHVKLIMGIGQCRERILEFGNKHHIPTKVHEYLKDAMEEAYTLSNEGDTLLLSPASASWDQYEKCEVRGDEFKAFVQKLIENNTSKNA